MDVAINSGTDNLQQGLEALFVEVNGLANRLKSTNPTAAVPSASRGALQHLLRFGPQTVPQIARARFSSRQNIQILINRLQQEGLVELVTNPEHKRSALVQLTDRGQAVINEAAKEESQLSTKILPSFSQTELSSAAEILGRLRRLLDGKETPQQAEKPERSEKSLKSEGHPSLNVAGVAERATTSGSAQTDSTDDGELPVSLL